MVEYAEWLRAYTDIVRQDSSFPLRNGTIRAGWASGENLWDVDMRNNWSYIGFWSDRYADYRRAERAPWPPAATAAPYWQIDDQPGSSEDALRYVVGGGGESLAYRPVTGSLTYVGADRSYVAYTGSGWRAVASVLLRPAVEISVFVNDPRTGGVCARVIVERAFVIRAGAPWSRCRGVMTSRPSEEAGAVVKLFKNDDEFGELFETSSTSGIKDVDADVHFDVGDHLTLRFPSLRKGITDFSVTIFGELL